MDQQAREKKQLTGANRLICLMAGVCLTSAGGPEAAGQQPLLGVSATVVRSCRVDSKDVVASARDPLAQALRGQGVDCGRPVPHQVSIQTFNPQSAPENRADTAQDGLVVTLIF